MNFVRDKQGDKGKEPAQRVCYRCGQVGHFGLDRLSAPRKEKLPISAEELTNLVRSVKRTQPNLPNLDGKRRQKEGKRRRQSGM